MKLFLAVSALIVNGALAQPFHGEHTRGGFRGGKFPPSDNIGDNPESFSLENWIEEVLGDNEDPSFEQEGADKFRPREKGHHHHHGVFPGPRQKHRSHPLFPDFNPRKYITNITCPVADDAPDCRPLVPHPFKEKKAGTWVCRTLYNPVTGEIEKHHSMCIDDHRALITDKCGCCDPEGCPKPCECPCGENGEGVLVDISPRKTTEAGENEAATFTKCVPSELAISAIAMTDRVQCHASCGEE